MQLDNLGTIERKVLGAMLIMADDNHIINATLKEIATAIGYKSSGGALTFAIKILEHNNYIVKTAERQYKLLI